MDVLEEDGDYQNLIDSDFRKAEEKGSAASAALESLRQLDGISYLTDMALCSDKREQEALYRNLSFETDKIQKRITEYKITRTIEGGPV